MATLLPHSDSAPGSGALNVESSGASFPLLAAFGDPEIDRFLDARAQVEAWLRMERALAKAQAEFGVIPAEAAAAIQAEAVVAHVDIPRLWARTRVVGYPILPLLEQVIAASSEPVAHWLHWGATTQDVMDTGIALRYSAALAYLRRRAVALGDDMERLATAHRSTLMAGRTHGQHAVPTTFGAKLASQLSELQRNLERLDRAADGIAVIELFGAAGTAAGLGDSSADVRRRLAELLGLGYVDVPWHTARDRVTEVAFVLASLAGLCGRIGREVAELARPEIGELHESDGGAMLRGASSTMPQKQNPIDSETAIGMSVMASQLMPAALHAAQGVHERSTGEWQAEWDALPLLFSYSAGALAACGRIMDGLEVSVARMRANLELDGGLVMAEAAMMAAAVSYGRNRAHQAVYAACAIARERGITLHSALAETLDADALGGLPLEEVLTPERYLGEAGVIVDRAVDAWRIRRSHVAVHHEGGPHGQ